MQRPAGCGIDTGAVNRLVIGKNSQALCLKVRRWVGQLDGWDAGQASIRSLLAGTLYGELTPRRIHRALAVSSPYQSTIEATTVKVSLRKSTLNVGDYFIVKCVGCNLRLVALLRLEVFSIPRDLIC